MKAKELIRLLREADPTEETEVSVGNCDILDVHIGPACYDGRLQLLIRDDEGYVTGAKYVSEGSKIVITEMGVTDVLWSDPKATIDYSGVHESLVASYKERDEKTRLASRNVEIKVDRDAFVRWAEGKAKAINPELEGLKHKAEVFYGRHLTPEDPTKELPSTYDEKHKHWLGRSWDERRSATWDDTLEVNWTGEWTIRKKDDVIVTSSGVTS